MSKTGISVYLAARFPTILAARKIRDQLVAAGIEVTSRWLEEEPSADSKAMKRSEKIQLALMDVYDVRRALALVLYNPDEMLKVGGGGCHVEVGLALAYGMPVYILGNESNIFHALPNVTCCEDMDELLAELEAKFAFGAHEKQLSTFGHRS